MRSRLFHPGGHRAGPRVTCGLMAGALLVASWGVATAQKPAEGQEVEERPRIIAIVTNLSNPTPEVSKAELGRIFLKRHKFWDSGIRCIPIDQSGTSEIRAAFYEQTLGRDQEALKHYWMRETMTGNTRPPVTVENSITVKKYIEKLEGAIGYIWADEVDGSIQLVHVTDDPRFQVPRSDTADEEAGEEQ